MRDPTEPNSLGDQRFGASFLDIPRYISSLLLEFSRSISKIYFHKFLFKGKNKTHPKMLMRCNEKTSTRFNTIKPCNRIIPYSSVNWSPGGRSDPESYELLKHVKNHVYSHVKHPIRSERGGSVHPASDRSFSANENLSANSHRGGWIKTANDWGSNVSNPLAESGFQGVRPPFSLRVCQIVNLRSS